MYKRIASLVALSVAIANNTYSHHSFVKEYEFLPGKAVVIINTQGKAIAAQCEMHVASNVAHHISITAVQGNGVVNGTTIKKGDSMVLAVRQMQRVPVSAVKDSEAQFVNLGSFVVKATCE